MTDIKPCICGIRPVVRELFGRLAIGCRNEKCKLKPDTWIHASTTFDVRKIIKFWNEGIEGK